MGWMRAALAAAALGVVGLGCATTKPPEYTLVSACPGCDCETTCVAERKLCQWDDGVCDVALQRCQLVCKDGAERFTRMMSKAESPAVPLPESMQER